MPDNQRSRAITQGAQRSPNRAMLRAVGFSDTDFDKPIVGVANGYSLGSRFARCSRRLLPHEIRRPLPDETVTGCARSAHRWKAAEARWRR